jgi:hypothetical protein
MVSLLLEVNPDRRCSASAAQGCLSPRTWQVCPAVAQMLDYISGELLPWVDEVQICRHRACVACGRSIGNKPLPRPFDSAGAHAVPLPKESPTTFFGGGKRISTQERP